MAEEEDRDGAGTAADTYFSERPRSRSQRSRLRFLYRGEILDVEVDRGIFASSGLDRGTALLIENMAIGPTDSVLDIGCGWGAIGLAVAKSAPRGRVVLIDVNRRAAYLARKNLARNGVTNAEVRVGSLYRPVEEERFDVIATNPPYRAGRELIEQLFDQAPDHLRPGGRLIVVGKGSQGIRFYQGRLAERWPGPVEVLARGSGYRVIEARSLPTPGRGRGS